MRKVLTIFAVVTIIFAVSEVSQATITNIVSGDWTRTPAADQLATSVDALGYFDDGGLFTFNTVNMTAEVASSLPGYTWERTLDVASFLLILSEGMIMFDPLNPMTMTGYTKDVDGWPSKILFVGEALTLDGRSVHFEAYWDDASNPLNKTLYPMQFSADFTSGFVEVVPEPTTICLLGLGGLMLRRRKSA